MKYKPLDGIVLTRICGNSYLIPTRAASQQCSSILRLTLPGKIMWEKLEAGEPIEGTVKALAILLKKPEAEVEKMAERYFATLCRKGFLIEEN